MKNNKLVKAIFLDRDGTIIKDKGDIATPAQVELYPFAAPALRQLQQAGFLLFIITNQSGIAKKVITEQEVNRVNHYLVDLLKKKGVNIESVYYCPHEKEDQCKCRKPSPYFIYQARQAYGLSLLHCFVVGDHPSDMLLANNSGTTGIYVLTGHGKKHQDEIPEGIKVCKDLKYAARFILENKEEY